MSVNSKIEWTEATLSFRGLLTGLGRQAGK
jgi:hypothetical protein